MDAVIARHAGTEARIRDMRRAYILPPSSLLGFTECFSSSSTGELLISAKGQLLGKWENSLLALPPAFKCTTPLTPS